MVGCTLGIAPWVGVPSGFVEGLYIRCFGFACTALIVSVEPFTCRVRSSSGYVCVCVCGALVLEFVGSLYDLAAEQGLK